jgi:hypothetical protein
MTRARWYDLVAAHWADWDDQFVRRLREFSSLCGVNLFVVEPLWVEDFLAKYQAGKIEIGAYMDLASEFTAPEKPYTRLAYAAKQRNALMINDPDCAARFGDKGEAHLALEAAEMPVPYSVVVRHDEIGWRKLTDEERRGLVAPFFVKPAHGYGGSGVIADAHEIQDVQRCSARFPDSHYLLQRRVIIGDIGGQPCYWRVIFALGEMYICWWHPLTRIYTAATQWQIKDYGLWRLFELGNRLAEITGLRCFSVEIARATSGEYVLVDYVNDQIDLRPKSFFVDGVPDEIIRQIAWRIVRKAEESQRVRHVDRESDLQEEQFPSVRDRYRAAGQPWPPAAPSPTPQAPQPAREEVPSEQVKAKT